MPTLPPRRPAPDPRADPRRGGLPRAGDRDDRAVRRRAPTPRPTRRGARSATSRGWPRPRLWFFPRALGRGYSLPVVEADLEGARGVRVVRLLQGPRRGVRAADLPVGLAQGALPGALPGRGAHPRPGHVPQAADPRRRPPVRHRGARPRRQRQREGVRRRAGRRSTSRRRSCSGSRRAARRDAARPTAGPGASGWRWPRSRASTRPRSTGSSRPGPTTR